MNALKEWGGAISLLITVIFGLTAYSFVSSIENVKSVVKTEESQRIEADKTINDALKDFGKENKTAHETFVTKDEFKNFKEYLTSIWLYTQSKDKENDKLKDQIEILRSN